MTDAKVVSLHSDVMATNEPCQDVIALLEQYLDEARRGEIIAVALATVEGNNNISSQWAGGRADRHFMVAACALMAHRVCQEVLNA